MRCVLRFLPQTVADSIKSKDADSVRVKRECSVTEVEEVFVKRERDDGGDVVARGKEKRRKTERRRQAEVVVIDD
jgi:hypothetical protein